MPSSGTSATGGGSVPKLSGGAGSGAPGASSPMPPRVVGPASVSVSARGFAPTGVCSWPASVAAGAADEAAAGAAAPCGLMLPRNGWPVAYCAHAGAGTPASKAAARAPAALRYGDAARTHPQSTPERRRKTPRVHRAVDRPNLGEIELTSGLGLLRNGPSLEPDGAKIRAKVRTGANQGGARSCRSA